MTGTPWGQLTCQPALQTRLCFRGVYAEGVRTPVWASANSSGLDSVLSFGKQVGCGPASTQEQAGEDRGVRRLIGGQWGPPSPTFAECLPGSDAFCRSETQKTLSLPCSGAPSLPAAVGGPSQGGHGPRGSQPGSAENTLHGQPITLGPRP